MKIKKTSKSYKVIVFLLAISILITLITTTLPKMVIAGQSQDRVITKLRDKPLPVDIKTVKTKKIVAEIGRNFLADDDWLKELTISIENTSGKTIIYIGGGFLFPKSTQQGAGAPPLYHRFMYGLNPLAPEEVSLINKPINVKPGETFDITISEEDYDSIKKTLNKLGYPASIKEIKISIEEIYFDDGTGWSGGNWYQRDSNNPKKYNHIEKKL